jgi:hypothetical protein
MDTPSLFVESIDEAVAEVAHACGGRKALAVSMWPSLPVRDAHNRFDACCNPERREQFHPSDLLYIARRGREAGCHSLMLFIARETGYSDPQPLEPEDERANLQREFIRAQKGLEALAKRMERAGLFRSAT